MEAMMMQFKDLQKIPFEEITKATNNFHEDNYLGGGGFGKVYKGELSRFKERGMVAFKQLDRQYGQGETEFLKEISTLSQYKHENLIALLGYCIKEREMILVYEYTAHGSLDFHLGSRDLTWTQRLKICLQAAEGLRYLHDPNGAHHKLIHRDIKSGNILLDEKWNAKVADLGLSKISPENANLVTKVTGTPGYTDPEYHKTYMLTEHSDVYSFGVTLFEVLCGSLCYEIIGENNLRVFVRKWKESYQENKLEEIIFKELDRKLIDPNSIKLFSDIAYQCLNESREERPSMAEVVKELEVALQRQEDYGMILMHPDPLARMFIEIVRAAVSPVKYRSIEELKERLSEGVLINEGKTWFSLNEYGEPCVMLSIAHCLISSLGGSFHNSDLYPRFSRYYYTDKRGFKVHIRTQFLTPSVRYTVNLVIGGGSPDTQKYVALKYKLEGETQTSIVYFAKRTKDGSLVAELYQFTSEERVFDHEIVFFDLKLYFQVEGILLQPLEKVEHEQVVEDEKLTNDSLQWTMKKDLFSNLFKKSNGQKGYAVDNNGKKCLMFSARGVMRSRDSSFQSLSESRFGEVALITESFEIITAIKSKVLSPETTYAIYLVYKLPQDQSIFEAPLRFVNYKGSNSAYPYTYLVSPPDTPIIGQKLDQITHNQPLNRSKLYEVPRQRSDGWMEVKVREFETPSSAETIDIDISIWTPDHSYTSGLIIESIEFRPV